MSTTEPPAGPPPEPPREPPREEQPGPVRELERIPQLDIIRGIALMGILLVNILSFGMPHPSWIMPGFWAGETALDRATSEGISLFILGKFYPMFTILFGVGLAIQYRRLRARGAADGAVPPGVLFRRLGWLLAIGLLHVVLFWEGDILLHYALAGLVAVWLLRVSSRIILFVAITMLVFSYLCCSLPMGAMAMLPEESGRAAETFEPASIEMAKARAGITPMEALESFFREPPHDSAAMAAIYKYGTWREAATFRIAIYGLYMLSLCLEMRILGLIGLVLLGVLMERRGFFTRTPNLPSWVFAFFWGCLVVGLAGTALLIYYTAGRIDLLYARYSVLVLLGVTLALGYLNLLRAIPWERLGGWVTAPLSALGRMALSNYLLASVFFTTLFYGHGFGLYGEIRHAGLALLAVAFWVVQMAFSLVWLRYFRFGPLEWAWRSLTYRKLQPLSRASP